MKLEYMLHTISWNPYYQKWVVDGYEEMFNTIDMAKEAIDRELLDEGKLRRSWM